jgi:hypothetical protein
MRRAERIAGACALLAADLGDAFKLPGVDPQKCVQRSSKRSGTRTVPGSSGGFAYWPGACDRATTTAYLLRLSAATI